MTKGKKTVGAEVTSNFLPLLLSMAFQQLLVGPVYKPVDCTVLGQEHTT